MRFRLLRKESQDLQKRLCRPSFCRTLSTRTPFLHISEEVLEAVESAKPVVALESTIYTHGFPYPENVALSSCVERLVRNGGGVPATIGVLNGVARVGLQQEELIELLESAGNKKTLKVSRRDLPYICGLGIKNRHMNGGTTVSGTMVLAHLAGIKVFATGGLGGVHQDGQTTMDISADLTELGRTPVAVISSGCKSFLDILRTLEYLETQGVCVGTFADGRTGSVDLPAFWTRESGVASAKTIENEAEAAAMIHAQMQLQISSGLLFANPIPEEYSLSKSEMHSVMSEALRQANEKGVSGSANTPFVLAKIRELTNGATVTANRALVEANVVRGTKVAVELAKLELKDRSNSDRRFSHVFQNLGVLSYSTKGRRSFSMKPERPRADVLVAGSLAIDISCDYNPDETSGDNLLSPRHHTSNPAITSQSLGGVGQNIASAVSYLGTDVQFCSAVAHDASGQTAITMLADRGLRVDGVEVFEDGSRTAQYIAFNDKSSELVMAMADMRIFENKNRDFDRIWGRRLRQCKPKWLVVDANWDSSALERWTYAGKRIGAKVAYEPVSVEKSGRIFDSSYISNQGLRTLADLATPNRFELNAMYKHARHLGSNGKDRNPWPLFLNSVDFQDRFSKAQREVASHLRDTEKFIVLYSLLLLPYFPCILTKVDASGVLLTEFLRKGDPRLTADWAKPYVFCGPLSSGIQLGSTMKELSTWLGRQSTSNVDAEELLQIGKDLEYLQQYAGVYMRLFPPAEIVPEDEIVSVNGVGDTFLGVIIAGLAEEDPRPLDELVMLAQRASVMTLKIKKSVSPEISSLGPLLKKQACDADLSKSLSDVDWQTMVRSR